MINVDRYPGLGRKETFSTFEEGPVRYLTQAGYSLQRGWTWKPKDGVSGYDDMTQEEYDCLLFLVHEWDYGGLSTEARPG